MVMDKHKEKIDYHTRDFILYFIDNRKAFKK